MATKKAAEESAFVELGDVGLKRFGGYVDDEFLPELKGAKGRKVIREMVDNDSTIGACRSTIRQYMAGTEIAVEDGEDDRAGMIVRTSIENLSHTFRDHVIEALSFLDYGWQLSEVCYDPCDGKPGEEITSSGRKRQTRPSRFSDGVVRWRKFAPRSQHSLDSWEFGSDGNAVAFRQRPAPSYQLREIPIEKVLLHRSEPYLNSPESRSQLRSCYVDWYCAKRLRIIEGIGMERELNGLPIFRVPKRILSPMANAADKAQLEAIKKIAASIRQSVEDAYLLLPSDTDKEGKLEYDFALASTQGRRAIDISGAIARYQTNMAIAMMADFIRMGHEKVGTQALIDGKLSVFDIAILGWWDSILGPLNRYAIPRLLAMNGYERLPEKLPTIVAKRSKAPDLTAIATYMNVAAVNGFLTPTEADEDWSRGLIGAPLVGVSEEVGKRGRGTGKVLKYNAGRDWAMYEHLLKQHQAIASTAAQARKLRTVMVAMKRRLEGQVAA